MHLPFDPENPSPGIQERFFAVAGDASKQPVYFHCGSATRAAIMWMLGRSIKDGVDRATVEQEAILIAEKPEEVLAYFSKVVAIE